MADGKPKAGDMLRQRIRQLAEEARCLNNPVLDAIFIEAELEIQKSYLPDRQPTASPALPSDRSSLRR